MGIMQEDSLAKPLRRIWVLTDGRAGNEKPALALAQALKAHLSQFQRDASGFGVAVTIDVLRMEPRGSFAILPARLVCALPIKQNGWPFSLMQMDKKTEGLLQGGHPDMIPDLIIGAGRRTAPVGLALKKLSKGGCRLVWLMDPKLPPRLFDALLVPEHDQLLGPNILSHRFALSDITKERLAEEAAHAPLSLRNMPEPRLAVLLGGPSGSARYDGYEKVAAQIAEAAMQAASVMVTPSRRTPPEMMAAMSKALASHPHSFIWDGEGPNPYHAMLALADLVAVSADSVNMVSEACATGKPVALLMPDHLRPKLRRFLDAIEKEDELSGQDITEVAQKLSMLLGLENPR